MITDLLRKIRRVAVSGVRDIPISRNDFLELGYDLERRNRILITHRDRDVSLTIDGCCVYPSDDPLDLDKIIELHQMVSI